MFNTKRLASAVLTSAAVGLAGSASGLALDGVGFGNTFSGTLGPVDIVAVDDGPSLSGGVTSGGIIDSFAPIPVVRVQYDLYNRPGNVSITAFTVPYETGVSVLGAANPGRYIDAAGVLNSGWAGSNSTTLFDSGFGTYTADATAFGSDWEIDFASDSVTWRYTGSGGGFLPDTATGRTDLGNSLPTFAIAFAAGTPLELVTADVSGLGVTGGPVSSSGRTPSGAVPEPASAFLVLAGVASIAGRRRRASRLTR